MKRPLKLYDVDGKRIKPGNKVGDISKIYIIEKIEKHPLDGLYVTFGKGVGTFQYLPKVLKGKRGVHFENLKIV